MGERRFEHGRTELACLSALRDRLPVPIVRQAHPSIPRIELVFVAGEHGQDLVDRGHARIVLELIGATLTELQQISASAVPGLHGDGSVIVHGDFGPQNMLFDLDAGVVAGILDWEFAHYGDRVEDLAWAEWSVRMHHPHAVDALDSLFRGAGRTPPWAQRHEEMLRRVRIHLAEAEVTGSAPPWRQRLEATERWSE